MGPGIGVEEACAGRERGGREGEAQSLEGGERGGHGDCRASVVLADVIDIAKQGYLGDLSTQQACRDSLKVCTSAGGGGLAVAGSGDDRQRVRRVLTRRRTASTR